MADEERPQPANLSQEPEAYVEKSAVGQGMKALTAGAGSGLFISTIQNALQKHERGAMGIFTRTGGTITAMAAAGGMFGFADAAVANFRGTDDPINGAAGGCAAGLVMGANARSLPMMAGSCIGLAALIGTFEAAGGSLMGNFATANPVAEARALGLDHDAPSEPDWREQRDERRRKFFKRSAQETKSE